MSDVSGLDELAAAQTNTQPVAYASGHTHRPPKPPAFVGIVIGSLILHLIALLIALVGCVPIAEFISRMIYHWNDPSPRYDAAGYVDRAVIGLGMLAAAALLSMVAQLARAVRHIARNSFRP